MAIPTNDRVEAVSSAQTVLRWTDTVAVATLDVQRSIDGVIYSSIATVAHGVETYTDEGLIGNTKYWYKLSQDAGVSFTTPITVWSHMCDTASSRGGAMPRAGGIDDVVATVNELSETVEASINRSFWSGTPSEDLNHQCDACVSDGRLILDCSLNCEAFSVVVTEDINSISVINCSNCPPVNFLIPPSSDVGICGWPAGCFHVGDECFDSREVSDLGGQTAFTDGTGRPGLRGGGCTPNPPDPDCLCPYLLAADDILSVICCTPGNSGFPNCVLSCDEPVVVLKACGGCGPYTWEIVSGPGKVVPVIGNKVVVIGDYPTNAYPASPGTEIAYYITGFRSRDLSAGTCVPAVAGPNSFISVSNPTSETIVGTYNCAGVRISVGLPELTAITGNLDWTNCNGSAGNDPSWPLTGGQGQEGTGSFTAHWDAPHGTFDASDTIAAKSQTDYFSPGIDMRTAELIAAGCHPGELCDDSVPIVVKVTDKVNTTVTLVM